MRKLGLIGGIGPESTIKYYRLIIEHFQDELKTNSYPEFLIESINMTEMLNYAFNNELKKLSDFLYQRIEILENSGADFAALASNTPHIVVDDLKRRAQVPIISIVDETCKAIKEKGITKIALIGTKSTMTAGFYQEKADDLGIEVVIPEQESLEIIHEKYMNELVLNKINPETKSLLIGVTNKLIESNSIEGVILGGTELSLILEQQDFEDLVVFDTTKIHAASLVKYMIG